MRDEGDQLLSGPAMRIYSYSRHLNPLLSFLSEHLHRAPLSTLRILPQMSQSVTKNETRAREICATRHTIGYQGIAPTLFTAHRTTRVGCILRICGRTHIRHRLGALDSVVPPSELTHGRFSRFDYQIKKLSSAPLNLTDGVKR